MTRALGSLRALFTRRPAGSKASSRLESALSAACWAALVYAFAMLATPARGGDLQEYVRLRGLEGDRLVGLGLVYGLAGTGDSMKDSTISSQPYAQLLKNLGNIAIDLRSGRYEVHVEDVEQTGSLRGLRHGELEAVLRALIARFEREIQSEAASARATMACAAAVPQAAPMAPMAGKPPWP